MTKALKRSPIVRALIDAAKELELSSVAQEAVELVHSGAYREMSRGEQRAFLTEHVRPAEARSEAAENSLLALMQSADLPAFVANGRLYIDLSNAVERPGESFMHTVRVDLARVANLDAVARFGGAPR